MSKETITRITDGVFETMTEWQNRPLDPVYPVVFIDAIHVKIREGQVANRPIYVAVASPWTASATFWGVGRRRRGGGQVLASRADRDQEPGRQPTCASWSATAWTGLPDAVGAVWPQAIVQTCVVHLLSNSFRYASRKDWPAMAKDLKPVYTAPTEAAALDRLADFAGRWEARYPAIVQAVGERLGRVRALLELRPRDPHRHLHHG